MELNKLEKQFKEKLNNREINPSEAAWDRLDAMLSVEQKPKQKFSWMYVAASFIGLLLVGTIFFNTKENEVEPEKNEVVIENTIPKINSNTEIIAPKKVSDFAKTILKEKTIPLVQTQKNTKSQFVNQTIITTGKFVENESQKQNEGIVSNRNLQSENIDSLLVSVENKSISNAKKSALKVNSTHLLSQVDNELQLSFREKALNTVTKKYKEAREALANRNNQ